MIHNKFVINNFRKRDEYLMYEYNAVNDSKCKKNWLNEMNA